MSDSLCLVPDCGNSRHCRGLCKTHYNHARHLIAIGQASAEDLTERGLMLPTAQSESVLRLGSRVRGRNQQQENPK